MGSAVAAHVHGMKEADVCRPRSRSFHMYGVCVFLIFVGGFFFFGCCVNSASFIRYRKVVVQ
jgi:hypothetical protein